MGEHGKAGNPRTFPSGLYMFERRLNMFGKDRVSSGVCLCVRGSYSLLGFSSQLLNGFKSAFYDTRSFAAWRSTEARVLTPPFCFSS